MTKPIVSLAVLMLHEEGRFLLDDPVAKFLPELENLRVASPNGGSEPMVRAITIKDLLTHRAGLTYAFINRGPVGELYRSASLFDSPTARDLVRKLAELPLVHQPGTTFEYSHATDVLGVLVEVVSGKSLDVFLRERILAPLGMKDTDFYLPEEKAERLVTLYRREEGKALQPVENGRESRIVRGPKTFFSGGGGLVSTAGDYFRFLQMLLDGGELDGIRLVSPKTVELMTADHVGQEIPVHPGYGFGLGFAVRQEIGRGNTLGSRGEYNWGGIDNTEFFVDPEEELLAIFCTNVSPYDMHRKWYLKTLVYQALVD
jgi:CubicO group peptidase (beta-lactamase class C family)